MIAPSVPGLTAVELRRAARAGRWTTPTNGVAAGHVQANLVALPAAHAADFERFCRENPRACPLLEVTDPGAWEPRIAPGADVRTDLPRYQVHRDGQMVAEPTDVTDFVAADMVAFLIGCSFSFEQALMAADIPLCHISERRNVAMYRTSVPGARRPVPSAVRSSCPCAPSSAPTSRWPRRSARRCRRRTARRSRPATPRSSASGTSRTPTSATR